MLRKVEFDSVYSFIYSPRKDTPAAKMDGQIPDEVKKKRFARLLEVQNSITKDLNSEYVGKTIKILVEGKIIDASYRKRFDELASQMNLS